MATILFIWVFSGGIQHPPVTVDFYTADACDVAKKAASSMVDMQPANSKDNLHVTAYCSFKKLPREVN